MKKIFVLFLSVISLLSFVCFSSCKNSQTCPLCDYIIDERSDIFYGKTDDIKLKAFYGYSIEKVNNENKKINKLTIIIVSETEDKVDYFLTFSFNDKNYNSTFSYSPIFDALSIQLKIDDFDKKSFSIIVTKGSINYNVTLSSIISTNTISVSKALNSLLVSQSELLKNYMVDGEYSIKIIIRVLVKNDKTYYYVALISKDNNTTCLLLDGENGNVLATKNIV